jgi:mRNA interferase RelE/StbE
MIYKIIIDDDALKELGTLPKKVQRQIAAKIDALANNPRPTGCEELKGRPELLKIRSGDYRIIYKVEDDRVLILVVRIRHRKDVYKRLP